MKASSGPLRVAPSQPLAATIRSRRHLVQPTSSSAYTFSNDDGQENTQRKEPGRSPVLFLPQAKPSRLISERVPFAESGILESVACFGF